MAMGKVIAACGLALLVGWLPGVPTGAGAQEEIRIGAVWGLTGPTAGVSQEGRRGMEMAQDALNKKGILGRKIRVIFEDDKADPAVGVSATEKLITQAKREDDRLHARRLVLREIHEGLPDSAFEVFGESGHMAPVEVPDRVSFALDQLMQRAGMWM